MASKLLTPKWNSGGLITNISHSAIISKGINSLLLDVDGTILPRSDVVIHSSVKEWIRKAKSYFDIHLISNNPSKKRISNIANQLNLSFAYKASKPRVKELVNYINKTSKNKNEIAIIGDRIFTDILAGNRLGIYTILVNPIDTAGKEKPYTKVQLVEDTIAKVIGGINI
ncbi:MULTISPECIES: YqeG family HAD IIIA-type phosphatase [unclassified Prochlorococcus]|uniref:YqeG family HAD IIIA-type phosphatase n=1 Tax=unclassified Prochlorococcus TaxID=2627481 RepID=UPI0005339AE9|nr:MULTISPECIES: YqeG family HAD IIIA-type phosphatase [unclassified Prochlorococcus]KGG15182.1 Hydrolase [Prochlorococcus sp. MIT 0602]KGG17456.1 Hydrolase [Prochlorococcus sp. MIT 0603]